VREGAGRGSVPVHETGTGGGAALAPQLTGDVLGLLLAERALLLPFPLQGQKKGKTNQ